MKEVAMEDKKTMIKFLHIKRIDNLGKVSKKRVVEVRCSRCNNEWFVKLEKVMEEGCIVCDHDRELGWVVTDKCDFSISNSMIKQACSVLQMGDTEKRRIITNKRVVASLNYHKALGKRVTLDQADMILETFVRMQRQVIPKRLNDGVTGIVYNAFSKEIKRVKVVRNEYVKAENKATRDYLKFIKNGSRGLYIRGKTVTAKKAYLYLYNIDDKYLGYGITIDIRERNKTHQTTFARHRKKGTLIYVFEGTGQEVEQVEYSMKQKLTLTNLRIDGFRAEATNLNSLDKVLTKFTKNLTLCPRSKSGKVQLFNLY